MEGTHENQNHSSPTKTELGLASLSLFNQSAHFSYIYKKTEKLVTAIYMITNFIKDSEPLKGKLRENALKLLSLNRAFTTVSLSDRKDLMKEYQGVALEVSSLATVAYHGGLISEMNAGVLTREFNALVMLIEKDENKKANEQTVILDSSFFQIAPNAAVESRVERPVSAPTPVPNVLYNIEHKEPIADKGHAVPAPVASAPAKPEYLSIKDVHMAPAPVVREKTPRTADSKDSRQSVILKILSKKGGLNIKDFTDAIKGVSAKTIQRELLSMVAAGVLKKEGERRWSTYSLAD
ncbi:MAG TPA: helix-turn-helix transcriptional regulator [Candidatus Paceibacterota bacterium]